MEGRKLFLHVYKANIKLLLSWENSKETTDLLLMKLTSISISLALNSS